MTACSFNISFFLQCLLFTALPFAEDVRQFTFGSLPSTSKQDPTGMTLSMIQLAGVACTEGEKRYPPEQ